MTTATLHTHHTVIPESELIHLKNWWRPVDETLWAKIQDQLGALHRIEETHANRKLIRDCHERLKMASWCIERRGHTKGNPPSVKQRISSWFHRLRWPFTEDNTFFWHLVHSVDEDLILLLPIQETAVQALEVKDLFDRNVRGAARKIWLDEGEKPGLLTNAVEVLKAAALDDSNSSQGPKVLHAKEIARRALHTVNEQTDLGFRQLAINMLMRSWSGFLLLVLMALTAWTLPDLVKRQEVFPTLLFLGASGAVLANLVSKQGFLVAMGPARRYFFYYLFAKPVHGAFVAMVMYLLLKSEILFALHASGRDKTAAAPFIIQMSPDALPFALAILAVVAGYSAERVFGTAVNRILTRLFKTAEKTEVTPGLTNEGCDGDAD